MSELRNDISKMNIRGELNLLFTMSKFIVNILDQAQDSKIAADTLCTMAESLFNEAAYVLTVVNEYTAGLHDE